MTDKREDESKRRETVDAMHKNRNDLVEKIMTPVLGPENKREGKAAWEDYRAGRTPDSPYVEVGFEVGYAAGFKDGLEMAAWTVERMNEPPQKPNWWEYSKAIRALKDKEP